eukprot:2235299-Rhodomonas_salina.2
MLGAEGAEGAETERQRQKWCGADDVCVCGVPGTRAHPADPLAQDERERQRQLRGARALHRRLQRRAAQGSRCRGGHARAEAGGNRSAPDRFHWSWGVKQDGEDGCAVD